VAGAPQEVLPVHVEWLAARGGGTARLRLHPPHLGEVQLNVRVRGSRVDVVIHALEPAAQHAAVASRDLLGDALAQRDLRMTSFDVRADEGGSGSQAAFSDTRDETGQGPRQFPEQGRGSFLRRATAATTPISPLIRRGVDPGAVDLRI